MPAKNELWYSKTVTRDTMSLLQGRPRMTLDLSAEAERELRRLGCTRVRLLDREWTMDGDLRLTWVGYLP